MLKIWEKFFKNFPTMRDQENPKARDAWAQCVSNMPGFLYQNDNEALRRKSTASRICWKISPTHICGRT